MIINQAIILAAGRGKRMKPLTDKIPKPLAQIKGKAMIDYILEKISNLPHINRIVVNSYYLAQVLEDHLHLLNNPKIIISHENEKLETGGGLLNALPLLDASKPILIINGDLFWIDEDNLLIKKMMENFDENKMDILLALKPKDQFFGYEGKGDFNFNKETGELTKSIDQIHSHVYIGVQVLHPRILKNPPKEICFSLSYFFNQALKKNRIKGIEVWQKAFHVGTIEHLYAINKNIILQ